MADATDLYLATRQRDLAFIKNYIAQGFNVNEISPNQIYSHTSLHEACIRGYDDVITLLVEQGHANLTQPDRYGLLPMHLAAKNGRTQTCQLLIDKYHQNPNVKCTIGSPMLTPVCIAIEENELPVVRLLVEKYKVNILDPGQGVTLERLINILTRKGEFELIPYLCWRVHCDEVIKTPSVVHNIISQARSKIKDLVKRYFSGTKPQTRILVLALLQGYQVSRISRNSHVKLLSKDLFKALFFMLEGTVAIG
jgi:hypothetical protein